MAYTRRFPETEVLSNGGSVVWVFLYVLYILVSVSQPTDW